ncbi:phage portal protein [Paraburkholderia susongensis]|uniref:Phage portal protein, HK97 family n=1 Tax=Paraburkholderia susongensis TaxID=1515439 RepID=A0A1X7I6Z3_9BURK|nr:phage portal protein [Paraburkholderia susongensis]SMG09605.1 phage portal protein, HK97 family [Paraburkholderia susongensis]
MNDRAGPAGGFDPRGSVILQRWNAERQTAREAAAVKAAVTAAGSQDHRDLGPVEQIVPGTTAYTLLTGTEGKRRAVTERTAMSVSTVYACVALIAGAIASITIEEHERSGRNVLPVDSDYWRLLNREMHPRWAAAVGWEFGAQSLILRGNLYQRIHRVTPYSPVVEFIEPMHPDGCDPRLVDGRLVYACTDLETGELEVVDQDDMIHVPGPGFDGIRGLSQIQFVLRKQVNTALAGGEMAETMMDTVRPDIAFETEQNINEKKIADLRNQYVEKYVGLENSIAPMVLPNGLKLKEIKRIGMSALDVQLVENRKLSAEEICEIFGVWPYMIGRGGSQPPGTADNIGINFVKYTLTRHLVKIQQELDRKLIRKGNRFLAHNVSSLERGDIKTRYEAYRLSLGRAGEPGWATQNEVRLDDNRPALDGGDELFNGTNDSGNSNEEPASAATE